MSKKKINNYFPKVEIEIDNNLFTNLFENLNPFNLPNKKEISESNNEDIIKRSNDDINVLTSFNYKIPNLNHINIENQIDNIIKKGNQKITQEIKICTSKKTLLGRKKKNDGEYGYHNKFSDDNLSRKCKRIVLNSVFKFINKKIKELYGNKCRKKLLKLNQEQIVSSKVNFNLEFLNKKLKEIFSDNISSKYKKYLPQYNKIFIDNLLNEKNEQIKNYFDNLFNLTFFDCLNHFRGKKYIKELDGMTNLDEICKNFKNEEFKNIYDEGFKSFILQFEDIINLKRPRNRRKMNQIIKGI